MNPEMKLRPLKNAFSFVGVEVPEELQKTANLRLLQLLAIAPPGAIGAGLLNTAGGYFRAAVTVRSAFRSFAQQALGETPAAAVRKALDRLEDDLFAWRYGAGAPQAPNALGFRVPEVGPSSREHQRQSA